MSARNRFHLETLETRQMMAGDVAAYVQNGTLYITEAAGQIGQDNGVRVSQLANGMIRVEGAAANNNTGVNSLVNGATHQDFMVPAGLMVTLGGGNDRLHLGYSGGAGAPRFTFVNVDMAAPEQVLSPAAKGAVTQYSFQDEDQFMGWSFHSTGAVDVKTGADEDWVFMGSVSTGNGTAAPMMTINTGSGGDGVTIKGVRMNGGLTIQTYSVMSENDDDNVYIDYTFGSNGQPVTSFIGGSVNVRMGNGADSFLINDPTDQLLFAPGVEIIGSLTVDTGAGDDWVLVRAAAIGHGGTPGHFTLYTGAGADDVTINFDSTFIEPGQSAPQLTGNLYVQTYASLAETDADIVRIPLGQIGGDITVRLGGGNDTFDFTAGNWGRNLTIDAGAGNDTGYLAGYIEHEAAVWMGDGNDSLTLGHVNADMLTIDGGAGSDSLRKQQLLAVDFLFENSWEYINGRPTWMRDLYWNASGGTLAMATM